MEKIKGSILVEFEMPVDRLSGSETADYLQRLMCDFLHEEWQTARCWPVMESFECKTVKKEE